MSDGSSGNEYLTVEEAAVEFRISESALYRALREQRVPGVKILGRWRISREDFTAHALRQTRMGRQRANPMARKRRSDAFRGKVLELRGRAPQ